MSGRHQVLAEEREGRPFGEVPLGPVDVLGIAQAMADGRAPRTADNAWGAHAFVLIREAGAVVLPAGGEHGPAWAEASALIARCRADWEKRPVDMDGDTAWARAFLSHLREIGWGVYERGMR